MFNCHDFVSFSMNILFLQYNENSNKDTPNRGQHVSVTNGTNLKNNNLVCHTSPSFRLTKNMQQQKLQIYNLIFNQFSLRRNFPTYLCVYVREPRVKIKLDLYIANWELSFTSKQSKKRLNV